MKLHSYTLLGISIFSLSSCASIDFGGDDGRLTYYDPAPYFFVSKNEKCVITGTVVILPGEKKSMKLNSGYGSAELSVALDNGMITKVGQTTDSKIPATITAISGLGTAIGGLGLLPPDKETSACTSKATLYPIKNGVPDYDDPKKFPL